MTYDIHLGKREGKKNKMNFKKIETKKNPTVRLGLSEMEIYSFSQCIVFSTKKFYVLRLYHF